MNSKPVLLTFGALARSFSLRAGLKMHCTAGKAGRVTQCAPGMKAGATLPESGAHGVTLPTCGFRILRQALNRAG